MAHIHSPDSPEGSALVTPITNLAWKEGHCHWCDSGLVTRHCHRSILFCLLKTPALNPDYYDVTATVEILFYATRACIRQLVFCSTLCDLISVGYPRMKNNDRM